MPQIAIAFFSYFFLVFRSNLGASSSSVPNEKAVNPRLLLFSIFFASNIVWMAYRASLTSELSTRQVKMPFLTLEELYHSDYK